MKFNITILIFFVIAVTNIYFQEANLKKLENESAIKIEQANNISFAKINAKLRFEANLIMELNASKTKDAYKIRKFLTNENNKFYISKEFTASMMKQESTYSNQVVRNKVEYSLGYWQMQWVTAKSLEKMFTELPRIQNESVFLKSISIQNAYFNKYFEYIFTKFPNLTLKRAIRMYNGGEKNYDKSPAKYYLSVLDTYRSFKAGS